MQTLVDVDIDRIILRCAHEQLAGSGVIQRLAAVPAACGTQIAGQPLSTEEVRPRHRDAAAGGERLDGPEVLTLVVCRLVVAGNADGDTAGAYGNPGAEPVVLGGLGLEESTRAGGAC